MARRRYARTDSEETLPEEWGALVTNRSLFNTGFLFGLGFAIANILVWGVLIFFALLALSD